MRPEVLMVSAHLLEVRGDMNTTTQEVEEQTEAGKYDKPLALCGEMRS